MNCYACPRKCAANRDVSPGACGMGSAYKVARAAPHFWEEPCISGTKGSGTVFFSGCSLGCVYCQNGKISSGGFGAEITEAQLTDIFDRLISQGVHNINLVNPTHYAVQLAGTLSKYHCPVPVVYNCGGYERVESLRLLEGLVDIYLPDLKYVSPEISKRYSGVSDYFEYAKSALIEMRRQIPRDEIDADGIMKRGLIVRQLILPKNTRNSIEAVKWLHENLPGTVISLMAQYTPCAELDGFPELKRKITGREYDKVVSAMLETGIENAYIQELQSAGDGFIPAFDLTGINN